MALLRALSASANVAPSVRSTPWAMAAACRKTTMTSLEEASARYERAHAEVIAAAETLRSAALAAAGSASDPAITILYTVARSLGVAVPEVLGTGRGSQIVTARQIAMVITRRLTNASAAAVATSYSGRSRATVIWAERTIDARRATEPCFKQKFDSLMAECAALTRKESVA